MPGQRIEDYAFIGDCHTGALVGRDGSIDWLCLPSFDSPACFAALVGGPENGFWRIAPSAPVRRIHRRYRTDSLVLETEFETDDGRVLVTDVMPVETKTVELVRIVKGLEGRVEMGMELVIRFGYGHRVPWVTRRDGCLTAVAGPEMLVLRTPVEHRGANLSTVASFAVDTGEEVPFTLAYGPSHLKPPRPIDPFRGLRRSERFWVRWAHKCRYDGPWRDAVVRSLITLKALTYMPTGGIVAAPTTSLPELIGGSRNWDYRYCWLRDATFTLLSLMEAGYDEDADAWRQWLVRAVAGLPSQLQPLYAIDGAYRIDEWEARWLAGYEGSRPVRIGNAASEQLQLDTYGEVLDVLHHARRANLSVDHASWEIQKAILKHLETCWSQPDCGIWEVRGPLQHFTHSKVMAWVAFDRGVSAVADFGLEGPVDRWRGIRTRLHEEICRRAFHEGMNAFTQAYDSDRLDAATLLIPLVGFLPASDPRMIGTVKAIGERLMKGGLVRRYDTGETSDGIGSGEGVFIACTCWYIDNLVLQGRLDEGRRLFERLLEIRNDVGLLSEEYDVERGRLIGNFPQALSHLALIDTAYNLRKVEGPARKRTRHTQDG